MNLFVFFALPLATILLAIVLQKILRSPVLVAITFFAIYLIVAFVAFPDTLAEAIIAAIVYTIFAYITALIVKILKKCFCVNRNLMGNVLGTTDNFNDLLTVDSKCSANNIENNEETGNAVTNIENTTNVVESYNKIRPVALGNTIANRHNIQRRVYRRW